MGSAFVSTSSYSRTIEVPGVDPFTVELRVLNSGHRAALRDALSLEFGTDDATELKAKMGTMELMTVHAALVSWSLDVSVSRATVEQLKPEVLEAIRDRVAWGRHPDDEPELEAGEAAEGQREGLEESELRPEEAPGTVPLPSSASGDAAA